MAEPILIVDGRARRPRTIREMPPEDRPRERLEARGPAGLSNAELIALVWGTGAPGVSALDLATEALAVHGGLAGLAAASRVELEAIPGIGAARAARLAAVTVHGAEFFHKAESLVNYRVKVKITKVLADKTIGEIIIF